MGRQQHVLKQPVEGFFFSRLHQPEGVAYLLLREAGAPADERQQGVHGGDSSPDPMGGAGDNQLVPLGSEAAAKALPQNFQQIVPLAQQLVSLLPVVKGNDLLDDGQILRRQIGRFIFSFFRNDFLQSCSSFRRYVLCRQKSVCVRPILQY